MAVNPVLVEVLRGGRVESGHRGAYAVVDAAGRLVAGVGDVGRAVFPRSAVKSIQALPLVESGAVDAYGFGDAELAIACASHNGEPSHVAMSRAMLTRAGQGPEALECGAHWPARPADVIACEAAFGAPTALHNNCSGKHAGFVCLACHAGVDPKGYVGPDHFVQREVTAALEDVTGTRLGEEARATDGCAIPTFAIPIQALALGMARMATGTGLGARRAAAARRLFAACFARPDMVAGEGRFCTAFMRAFGPEAFVKTGAEGVFCAALPALGLGIAVKIDDGTARAAEVVVADVIAGLLGRRDDPAFRPFLAPVMKNWNGTEVGSLRRAAG